MTENSGVESPSAPSGFEDLLEANRHFADDFSLGGFDGIAHAGIAVVTCMDSRIDPLGIIGLKPGDAKIFRNAGGRVTQDALEALVLAVHLLNVDRILVIPHTRCAMTKNTEDELHHKINASSGSDSSWQSFHVIRDQEAALRADVAKIRSHPLIAHRAEVGGFIYDVDTGLISRHV
jgi:carbonic anhydrase